MERRLAEALARERGFVFDDAHVIGEGTNVLVHLRPKPVVARVTRYSHLIRSPEALAGGIAIARKLGARAVAPSSLIDAGPHVRGGRYITFWEFRAGAFASPAQAGQALRDFHEATQRFHGPLRDFDPRPEALRVADFVENDAASVLRDAATRLQLPAAMSRQPLHGDAHFENVLLDGVWQDFDEVCFGPREWDVASMVHRWRVFGELEADMRVAVAAYGEQETDALDMLQPLVTLHIAAWGSLASKVLGMRSPRTQRRLEWLRSH